MEWTVLKNRWSHWLDSALSPTREPVSIWFVMVVSGFLFAWFWIGAVLVAETNHNRLNSDQQYNIDLAREAAGDWYPHRIKGIVEPLWPWLASQFLSESDAETFRRGKILNLVLGGIFLAACAFWLRRRWGALMALVFMSVGGLGVLLERSVYFQPEPIYYILSSGAFAAMLTLLRKNPLWLFALCGLLCGLSHLAKSAIMPMMAAYVGVSAVLVAGAWQSKRWPILAPDSKWEVQRHLIGLVLMVLCFCVVVAPRAIFSYHQYGAFFHSWPSYWMWQDDFKKESIPFMTAHPDRAALEAIPPDQIPSLGNYLATHTSAEIWQRLRTGMLARMHEFFFHEGKLVSRRSGKEWKSVLRYRGYYLVAALGVGILLAVVAARHRRFSATVFWPDFCSVVFVVGLFFLYWAAFGWYYAIGRGPRFMLALYLPMLYATLAATSSLANRLPSCSWARATAASALLAILVFTCLRMIELLVTPHFVP